MKASQSVKDQGEASWTEVTRKGKGKAITPEAIHDPQSTATISHSGKGDAQGVATSQEGTISCFELGAFSTPKRVVESTHALLARTKDNQCSIQMRNSFSGLIPYVYDTGDFEPPNDGSGPHLDEDPHELGDNDEETYAKSTELISNPISGRQKKKAAKILHSGSRPKGRRRA